MEVQPSIREMIDPWTRVGYKEEIKPNLFTGKPTLVTIIFFVYNGRAHSRQLNKSKDYGDSILFLREWYSVDLELVKLDCSLDFVEQLKV